MYDVSELKKGLRVELENTPYIIVDTQFVKPGKGQAFTRLKLKNLLSGAALDKTCKIGEKLAASDVVEKTMQFLYMDKDEYMFMDNETYIQVSLNKEQIAENWKWLTEGLQVKLMLHKDQPVAIEVPNFSIQKVLHCEAGIKGDRVSKAMKEVSVETGTNVQAPIFINEGDKIKIDTRTGAYVERVN
jgi:elongation factor P